MEGDVLEIGENVLYWTGMQSGSGLVFSGNDIVVVDTLMRRDQLALLIELMELYELDPKNVRYIINTHSDHDHSGGNAELKRLTGAKLVAHVADLFYIERADEERRRHLQSSSRFRVEQMEPFESCEVEVKVEEDTELQVGDLSLKLLHTPGHTNGSICIYYEDSNVLFSGDTVLGYGPPMVKANFTAMVKSLEKLSELNVKWLLPGHGAVVSNGRRRIEESLEELKKIPEQVLKTLEEPSTPWEVSDKLLIWPQTVFTVFTMLEKENKIRKLGKKVSKQVTNWTLV